MFVWSSTLCEFCTGTFWCTRQSRNEPKNRSLFATSGPPSEKLMSETKSDVFPLGRNPYDCSVGLVSLRPCSCWPVHVKVGPPCHRLPPVLVIMLRNTPEVGTVMSCAPVDTW